MLPDPVIVEGDWRKITEEAARYKEHRLRLIVLGERANSEPNGSRPILEVLRELSTASEAGVPEGLPEDFTDQLDHHVYGAPKR
jgi:hypothetical protein